MTNVLDEIETVVEDITPIEIDDDDPQVVNRARRSARVDHRQRTIASTITTRWSIAKSCSRCSILGLISLEDRAKGEVLFWDVCERADKYAQQAKYVSEEFGELRRLLCAKYLTNFSVFRSVPDHWALDQLFPIVPIHYLEQAAN